MELFLKGDISVVKTKRNKKNSKLNFHKCFVFTEMKQNEKCVGLFCSTKQEFFGLFRQFFAIFLHFYTFLIYLGFW